MRKRLCHFYNILASYPVIVLLLAGLVALIYLARQYYPLELQRQAKHSQRMELKQELQALQQELTGIEQSDLRMRYMLFNEEFLKKADAHPEALKSQFTQAFKVNGWVLQEAEVTELEISTEQGKASDSNLARIQGIMLDLSAALGGYSPLLGSTILRPALLSQPAYSVSLLSLLATYAWSTQM